MLLFSKNNIGMKKAQWVSSNVNSVYKWEDKALDYKHFTKTLKWKRLLNGMNPCSLLCVLVCSIMSHSLWTIAYPAPLYMGFSQQEYWSGLPFPPPGDLPDPGIEPMSPALQADSLPSEPSGKYPITPYQKHFSSIPCKFKAVPGMWFHPSGDVQCWGATQLKLYRLNPATSTEWGRVARQWWS